MIISSAILLSAGRGKRLQPLTDFLPKPLIAVKHKSLIIYHIEKLARSGIKNIVINISYLAEKIQETLQDGANWGVKIAYSFEPDPLETGGGIVKALPLLGNAPFLAVSSDIFTDYDFEKLINMPLAPQMPAHLVLVPNPDYHFLGDFSFDIYSKKKSVNKKVMNLLNNLPAYTYANIGVFHPDFFRNSPLGAFPLVRLIREHIDRRRVTGELYTGLWHNVGSINELEKLCAI